MSANRASHPDMNRQLATLPALDGESGLSAYLQQVRRFPMLQAEEEYMLARRWQQHGDVAAAHRLVTSHLRLVVRIAMGYRGYGLPMAELISEGNIGLMQGVKKFDPERGFRLSTYAMWWIKAAIQEFILHSWSLVKIGTTAAQKKLFFNLRKLKGRLQALDEHDLTPEQAASIARTLSVTEAEVYEMNGRMGSGDHSLNAPLRAEGGDSAEWQDLLVDEGASPEGALVRADEFDKRHALFTQAMTVLSPRERDIFEQRRLRDEPTTLEDLSVKYGISRERVRQIENRAFEKVRQAVRAAAA
jgi:RNA polymerase sigma-32 factor